MKKKILPFLILVLFLPLFGCVNLQVKTVRETEQEDTQVYKTNQIIIKNDKLIPDKISIRVGDEVSFKNQGDSPIIIASDPHPEHSEAPDLYSAPIYSGQTYVYKFSVEGRFGFHIEENPSISGRVIVKSLGGENNVDE